MKVEARMIIWRQSLDFVRFGPIEIVEVKDDYIKYTNLFSFSSGVKKVSKTDFSKFINNTIPYLSNDKYRCSVKENKKSVVSEKVSSPTALQTELDL